jgi:hypothetical protein
MMRFQSAVSNQVVNMDASEKFQIPIFDPVSKTWDEPVLPRCRLTISLRLRSDYRNS